MGLELNRKTFYNLQRKETEGSLSDQEEARLVLVYLESQGFHVVVDEVYMYGPDGEKKDRIILTIA